MYSFSRSRPLPGQCWQNSPPNQRTWLTVRNDDIYSFRWGDPAYARAYIRDFPGPEKLAGFYMGPDGYIWGREFISTEPESPRQLVIKKQWYSFMLWGRLSYDPSLPDALFEQTLAARFPRYPAAKLFAASEAASRIIPRPASSGVIIDLKWFPEACVRHLSPQGFYSVKHFIEGHTMPESGILNVATYCDRLLSKYSDGRYHPAASGKLIAGATPEQRYQLVGRDAYGRRWQGAAPDPRRLRAMAYLGNYYAEKILANAVGPV